MEYLKLTILRPAEATDSIYFGSNPNYPNGIGDSTTGISFGTSNSTCPFGTDAADQANKIYNYVLSASHLTPWYSATVLGNVVTIFAKNGSPFTSYSPSNTLLSTQLIVINPPAFSVISPYTDVFAFTLDPKYFTITSASTLHYYQVNLSLKVFDFFTNNVSTQSITLKIVLFKGDSKFNLGQSIHRYMNRFSNITNSVHQYIPSELTMSVFQKRSIDDVTENVTTFPAINFIAGLSTNFYTQGFLDFNFSPRRVTLNSKMFLNFLVPSGAYEIQVFKNTILDSTINLMDSQDKVMTYEVIFSSYQIGDIIEYKLYDIANDTLLLPSKKAIVFPQGLYSNTIIWEDEFLLKQQLECTGAYTINGTITQQSQVLFDLVERTEILDTSKETKLTINTGWLMISDINSIESLSRAKRCWLLSGNKKIPLRPIAKPILAQDTQRALIDFSLEFLINKQYNEETYSF